MGNSLIIKLTIVNNLVSKQSVGPDLEPPPLISETEAFVLVPTQLTGNALSHTKSVQDMSTDYICVNKKQVMPIIVCLLGAIRASTHTWSSCPSSSWQTKQMPRNPSQDYPKARFNCIAITFKRNIRDMLGIACNPFQKRMHKTPS